MSEKKSEKGMRWFDIKNRNYWRVSGKKEYTIQEVSDLSGITVRTLRNYLKGYDEVLSPKRGYYNSLVFSEIDVKTFVMIKTLIQEGHKQEQILEKVREQRHSLQAEEPPPTPNPTPTPKHHPAIPQPDQDPESVAPQELAHIQTRMQKQQELLENMNRWFLNAEERSAHLETRLIRMEETLEEIRAHQSMSWMQKLMDSTQAFFRALTRSL